MPWILGSLIIGMLIGAACAYLLAAKRIHRSVERVQSARKRAQAAERLAEIGSMTGGLAHEIKNPLSTIGLNAQLLCEAIEGLDIPDNDRTRLLKRIEALGRETDRLRGILEDFLEYAGELRLSVNLRQVNLIVEELADFFSPMVQGAGIRMRLELDPSDPSALVDADHLKQAILNLMLNALHAMGQPGSQQDELIVRTELTQSSADGPGVHIHVIDTGPGIDEQTRERIFHPYFTTKSGGTGLGLPTARRIIEAHHGRLELHSEVGKGSDFVLVIPAHSPNED